VIPYGLLAEVQLPRDLSRRPTVFQQA